MDILTEYPFFAGCIAIPALSMLTMWFVIESVGTVGNVIETASKDLKSYRLHGDKYEKTYTRPEAARILLLSPFLLIGSVIIFPILGPYLSIRRIYRFICKLLVEAFPKTR